MSAALCSVTSDWARTGTPPTAEAVTSSLVSALGERASDSLGAWLAVTELANEVATAEDPSDAALAIRLAVLCYAAGREAKLTARKQARAARRPSARHRGASDE